jgi:hypothetical protein
MIYLSPECDTTALSHLGFARLVRPFYTPPDPTINDLIAHPEFVEFRNLVDSQVSVYQSAWPIELNVDKLPDCVINLISDYHAGVKSGKGRAKGGVIIIK